MSKFTERLLQFGALCAIAYFGWLVLSGTVLYMLQVTSQLKEAQTQLVVCEKEKTDTGKRR